MAAVVETGTDRRLASRRGAGECPAGLSGRIRPGHAIRLLNASTMGALVETGRRLLPGTIVELQLESSECRETLRARVVRCYVSTVRPDGLVYRGGLAFERLVAWLGDEHATAATTASRGSVVTRE